MRFRHYGRIDETEDENDALPMVTENQTNHVVVTLSQQGSSVLSRSRKIIHCVIAVVENNKDNENHGSRRIKHLFLVSRKIILQIHASRLLWKTLFTRKKLAISQFTGKKGPITSHGNTFYGPVIIYRGGGGGPTIFWEGGFKFFCFPGRGGQNFLRLFGGGAPNPCPPFSKNSWPPPPPPR